MGLSAQTYDVYGWVMAQVELDGLMSQMETGILNLDALSNAVNIAIAHTLTNYDLHNPSYWKTAKGKICLFTGFWKNFQG
jgi:hypothetical protein